MKKTTLIKGILTLGVCFLVVLSALGWVFLLTPETAASEGNPTLGYVEGNLTFGASALADPVRVDTDKGSYYAPASYVYLGEDADGNPILFRVLDADADNTGRAGAAFLLAEDTTAWGEERYTLLDEKYDWAEWNYENYYQYSYPYRFDYQTSVFRNAYRNRNGISAEILPTEMDFLRPVTKEDDQAAMEGLYGYDTTGSYWWFAPLEDNYTPHMQYAPILNGDTVFLPSVYELANYVGDYNGAPGLASESGMPWWTRTSLNDANGNLVGAVKGDGTVEATGVFVGGVGARYATNLELGDIAFLHAVGTHGGTPVYKIAMTHPLYRDTDTPFTASTYNLEGRTLTVVYDNAIYDERDSRDHEGKNHISVMITDKESGRAIYYASVSEVSTLTSDRYREGILSGREGYALFDLPEDFDRETQNVSVFLERKSDDEGVSYISNIVTLDCVHTVGTPAHCAGKAICGDCGAEFGSIDPDHHKVLGDYVVDEENLTHRRYCAWCDALALEEACTFSTDCTVPCECGSLAGYTDAHHAYGKNGICLRDASHTQAFVGDGYYFQDIEIYNEGQFLSFAKYINRGGRANYVTLHSDLDFTGIDFLPVGTEEIPFEGIGFAGNGHTVTGIDHVDAEGISALFAHAVNVSVSDLTLTDCSFAGRIAAPLVGIAENVSSVASNVVRDCTVTGETAGAVIGSSTGSVLRATGAYNVTDAAGAFLPFVGAGESAVDGSSWVMAAETNIDKREFSEEDIASGFLAYDMSGKIDGRGRRVSQKLGVELYPTYRAGGSDPVTVVYGTTTCTGTPVYFNDYSRKESIEGHNYNAPAGGVATFVWDEFFTSRCTVAVTCGDCGHVGSVDATVDARYYLADYDHINSVIRVDYTPSVTLGGVEHVGEIKVVIVVPIASVIGMTRMDAVYDGYGVDPDELMTNHRLWGPDDTSVSYYWQYEAWFIDENGNRLEYREPEWNGGGIYPTNAVDAGTYDLLVVGKNEFAGQEVLYEDILVIHPATVTVTPHDVHREYDGTARFTPAFDAETDAEWGDPDAWIDVRYADATEATVGAYELAVNVTVARGVDAKNLNVVLTKERVTGVILPAYAETLKDVTYPTAATYGDPIPAPVPEDFGLDAGREVIFSWYRVTDTREDTRVAVDAPDTVGNYVLTVLAAPADGYAAATYYEHAFKVTLRTPVLTPVLPEGMSFIPPENDWEYPTLTLTSGQTVSVKVENLADGDTLESAFIEVEMEKDWKTLDAFPTAPTEQGEPYHIVYRATCRPAAGKTANYENVYFAFDVTVLPAAGAPPAGEESATLPSLTVEAEDMTTTDGEKGIDLTVNWEYILEADGAYPCYTVYLMDADGNILDEAKAAHGTDFGEEYGTHTFRVTAGGTYTVRIGRSLFGEYREEDQHRFEIYLCFDRDGELIEDFREMGAYEAQLYLGDEVVDSDTFTVRQTVVMYLKTTEFNLSDGILPYEKENVVTTADSHLARGHELVSVGVNVDQWGGRIRIVSLNVRDSATGADVSDLYTVDSYVENWTHADGGYNVCHVFDSACDDTCARCDYTRAATHSEGEAPNCIRGAICADCGAVYTAPNPNRHVLTGTSLYPNRDAHDTHSVIHVCCGGVISSHLHSAQEPPTCTRGSLCTDCLWVSGEKDPDNHTAAPVFTPSENGHTVTYPCCGKTYTEAHTGEEKFCLGTLCTDCGGYFGEKDPHNHTALGKYEAGTDTHAAVYPDCCGARVTEPHVGGSATCVERAKCERCLTPYGEVDPDAHTSTETKLVVGATNASVHEERHVCCEGLIRSEFHKGGSATCTTAATCEVCGHEYGTRNPENHESDEAEARLSAVNPLLHDTVRACCGEILSSEAHKGGSATCTHGTVCEVCGHDYGTPVAHTYSGECDAICNVCGQSTRPAGFHTDANADGKCDVCATAIETVEELLPDDGSGTDPDTVAPEANTVDTVMTAVGFSAAGVTVAGSAGFSVWWFVIKKKRWIDLVKPMVK